MTEWEEKLQARGWTRRSILSEPRLSEMKALYEELNFEVLLVDLDKVRLDEECTVCFTEEPERFKVIYTRPIKDAAPADEE